MLKISRFLARNWNLCNFGLYFSEFGCHGNSLGFLENFDGIFEVVDPESWLFMRKIPRFLAQNGNQCNFGLFWFKFGCHGNSLGSLKNSDSVLKFNGPEIPENWWVQFLAQIWLPWQPSWLAWNFIYYIRIRRPRKPFNYVINSSMSGTELKLVQFWLIFA